MIALPVFRRLDVSNYGLFPGPENRGGLKISFSPGLTLILGANGLGKTTIITMLFRLLTGPYDIAGLSGRPGLGGVKLEPKALSRRDRSVFGHRVVDGARNARARLSFQLNGHSLAVERSLGDLGLLGFSVAGRALSVEERESYQNEIVELSGLSSFGDWILLLRNLVFYFEDRRELVWDLSAQRQLLRLLFLSRESSRRWTDEERAILGLDSRTRNLLATVGREERALADSEVKIESSGALREELKTLEKLQEIGLGRSDHVTTELAEIDAERKAARLRLLTVEQEREARYREYERSKLLAIEARFPEKSETARFILAQLLSDGKCLACGHVARQAAAEYTRRIEREECVICGTDLSGGATKTVPELAFKRVDRAADQLREIEEDLAEAQRALEQVASEYKAMDLEAATLSAEIAARSARIASLFRRLPPEEGELQKQRTEFSLMRSNLEKLRRELTARRQAFAEFIQRMSRELATRSEEVKAMFREAAEAFLLDECELVWSPQKQRVGETGAQIEFPAFQLDMKGSDFASSVRRIGPGEVSESQREFIDLAFRMALIAVTGSGGGGSLVIDAPESSLDAVFSARAATVLAKFANRSKRNRLVVTSNLVESGLVPKLIAQTTKPAGQGWTLVDLLEIAVPTGAVRQLWTEYAEVRDHLLTSAKTSVTQQDAS